MIFLINPRHKAKSRKRVRKARQGTRRRVRRAKSGRFVKGGAIPMARRRRRRSVRHAAAAPRRRRRRHVARRTVVLAANPRRRRVRRRYHANPRHRRRYRRNPGVASGVVGTIKQGAVDGALVLVGQAAQSRVSALLGGFLPASINTGIVGAGITNVGTAVVIAIASKKVIPSHARMITAGAFATAVKGLVNAVAPSVGAMLGDTGYAAPVGYPGAFASGLGAWAQPPVALPAPSSRMGAYPGGGMGDGEEYSGIYS